MVGWTVWSSCAVHERTVFCIVQIIVRKMCFELWKPLQENCVLPCANHLERNVFFYIVQIIIRELCFVLCKPS